MSSPNLLRSDNKQLFNESYHEVVLKSAEIELIKPVLFPINTKIGVGGDLEMIGNSSLDFQNQIEIRQGGQTLISSDACGNVLINNLFVSGDLSANLPKQQLELVQTIPPVKEGYIFYDIQNADWFSYSKDNNYPCVRKIPDIYNLNQVFVADETQLVNAVNTASFGNAIILTEDITLSSPLTIQTPIKLTSVDNKTLSFNGSNQSTLIVVGFSTLIQNITIESLGVGFNDCAITFNNLNSTDNYVDNCVIKTNEFGIITNNRQIQISNNTFEFVGTPDSHRFISIQATQEETIIYNNVFKGHSTTQALFFSGTGSLQNAKILIQDNTNEGFNFIQRLMISERDLSGSNVSFYFVNNFIRCLNGYVIFFTANPLNGVKEIFIQNNTEIIIATGAKGIIGLDGTPGVINENINVYSDGNQQFIINAVGQLEPYQLRADYVDWTTDNSKLVAYKDTFTPVNQLELQEIPITLGKPCKGFIILNE